MRYHSQVRILHVTPYFAEAWAYGGIPRVVAAQVPELVRRGFEVTVATSDVVDERSRLPRGESRLRPVRQIHASGAELVVCANLSNRLAYRQQFFIPLGFKRWLREHAAEFDVAHLHACHNLLVSQAAQAFHEAGVPYLVQPNGTAPRIERRRQAKLAFDLLFSRHLLTRAAAVVAVTQVERRQLERLGVPPSRITIVPNPVNLTEFETPRDPRTFRDRWRLGAEPVVLYLGQVSPRKRVDLVVRAVAELADTSVQLMVAGSDMGKGHSVRRLVERLGLRSRTTFTGVLEGHERLEALAAANLVVYPTIDEIFGLVPLEAILCGTPVVVSDDCGCGEVISRIGGGQVVATADLRALAATMHEMLRRPAAWQEPVAAAARQARELFSAHAVGDRLGELYGRLTGGRSAHD